MHAQSLALALAMTLAVAASTAVFPVIPLRDMAPEHACYFICDICMQGRSRCASTTPEDGLNNEDKTGVRVPQHVLSLPPSVQNARAVLTGLQIFDALHTENVTGSNIPLRLLQQPCLHVHKKPSDACMAQLAILSYCGP